MRSACKKNILIIILFLIFISFCVKSQNFSPDTVLIDQSEKEKFINPLRISAISLSYSVSLYPKTSNNISHGKNIFNYEKPDWPNIETSLRHETRSDVNLGLSFSNQLFNRKSPLYGNLFLGFYFCEGNRVNVLFQSDEYFADDLAIIDGNEVTDKEVFINKNEEYVQRTHDLGFGIAYLISSNPQNIIVGEIGIGSSFLVSVYSREYNRFSYTESLTYIDQFGRKQNEDYFESSSGENKLEQSLFLRLFIPASFSYKLSARRNIALTSYFNAGVEMQKYQNSNFYSYTYFSVGLGVKYYLP